MITQGLLQIVSRKYWISRYIWCYLILVHTILPTTKSRSMNGRFVWNARSWLGPVMEGGEGVVYCRCCLWAQYQLKNWTKWTIDLIFFNGLILVLRIDICLAVPNLQITECSENWSRSERAEWRGEKLRFFPVLQHGINQGKRLRRNGWMARAFPPHEKCTSTS